MVVSGSRISHLKRQLIIAIGLCIILLVILVALLNTEAQRTQFRFIDKNYTDTNLKNKSINTLIDFQGFRYLLENEEICSVPPNSTNYLLLFLISSSRDNFPSRDLIRSTWTSLPSIQNWNIRYVFLLGKSNISEIDNLDFELKRESDKNKDIIIGNFIDSYRNLTYKQIMGYKWALQFCSHARLVIKTDDDVFIDIFQLINFINSLVNHERLIVGYVNEDSKPDRSVNGRWYVTEEEYQGDSYPNYCIGMGFIISFDLIKYLVRASQVVPYFWIEDVYVTGLLREYLQEEFEIKVQLFDIFEKYAFVEDEAFEKWLWSDDKKLELPWYFVHIWNSYFIGQFGEIWERIYKINVAHES